MIVIDKKKSKFKIILTTLCCLVGLACFCNSEYLGELNRNSINIGSSCKQITGNTIVLFKTASTTCYYYPTSSCEYTDRQTITTNSGYLFTGKTYLQCTNNTTIYWYNMELPNQTCPTCPTIDSNYCTSNNLCPACPTCPDQYSSLECQSEYNLIPISSVNQSYCVNNNLCPVSSGDCESGSINWSSLYINNIQHLGKPNIFITIPEEIDWDYTNNTGSFDLDIVGYNVDYEKMGEILEVQNYKPSSEDFTNLVGLLAPYMSILVFALFCFIVIRRLKKPFSSKLK